MPIYCFSNESGQVVERNFIIGAAPKAIKFRGELFRRDLGAERKGVPPTKGWPIECVGSGVNAEQGGELKSFLTKAGVPTEVSSDGNPIYRDANHRRKALKARGIVDKSSFI